MVPIVPGPDGAHEPTHEQRQARAPKPARTRGERHPLPGDRPDAWCAACGSSYSPRTRRVVSTTLAGTYGQGSVLLMLCDDAKLCTTTYRQGLAPDAYARQLVAAGLP